MKRRAWLHYRGVGYILRSPVGSPWMLCRDPPPQEDRRGEGPPDQCLEFSSGATGHLPTPPIRTKISRGVPLVGVGL